MKCRGKWSYSQPHIREYQKQYAQRPERRLSVRLRMRARYATEEYKAWARERWRRLFRDPFSGVQIPELYTGHRWLDMAREAVSGGRDVPPEFRDFGYNDEIGEALLALLEGRDMEEAVREFRAKEFVPRHLTVFTSEWHDDEDRQYLEDQNMPTSPSAEEEAVAAEAVVYRLKERFHWGKGRRRFGNNKGQQQPSRRRMKDGPSWKKHAERRAA